MAIHYTHSDGQGVQTPADRECKPLLGAVGRSLRGARGQRERAPLEAVDALVDVHGVRVDGRQADRGDVVGEVVRRVQLAVLGAVPAPLLVHDAPGEETEQAGAARGDAAERLDEQQRRLVVLAAQRVAW